MPVFFKIALGYAIAVTAAVLVVMLLLGEPTSDFVGIFTLGYAITFPSALPGFLLAIFVAQKMNLKSPLYFAATGALNVFPSLLIFKLCGGEDLFNMIDVFVPGGLAGGLVYWLIAVRWAARPSISEA